MKTVSSFPVSLPLFLNVMKMLMLAHCSTSANFGRHGRNIVVNWEERASPDFLLHIYASFPKLVLLDATYRELRCYTHQYSCTTYNYFLMCVPWISDRSPQWVCLIFQKCQNYSLLYLHHTEATITFERFSERKW